MNITEKKSAEKAKKIYEKLEIYKKYMKGKKAQEMRIKRMEEEKRKKTLKMNTKEFIKQKMQQSLSQPKMFNKLELEEKKSKTKRDFRKRTIKNSKKMKRSERGFAYITEKYFPLKKKQSSVKYRLKQQLKFYRDIFQYYGFCVRAYVNFVRINFRKNTNCDIKNRQVIFTMPSTVFDIHPTAQIKISAPFIFGNNPVRRMRMPTCLRMEENTTLEIHDGPLTRYGNTPYNLRYGAYIEVVNGGKLTIGQGAANVGLTIMCAKEVAIGNGVRIGRNVSIRDWNGSHVIINDTYRNHAAVHVEDHVWLCTGCTIMPGVTVGKGAVVAANSTVTKDVPPYSLVGGSPAKVLKENIEWY